MKKQIDKKKQKLRTASWVTITSTLIAIGGQLLVKSHNPSFEHHEEEHPCGSGAMSDLFDDSPSFEPSGFNIPSWKDGPKLPPGVGGGLIQRPKIKYTGPNTVSYYEQPVFVKDFFKNLNDNLPRNDYENNCGYVAATMLLSYYDTYWNPNFIPDQYNNQDLAVLDSLDDKEFESPGVKDIHEDIWTDCEPMKAPDKKSSQEYKDAYYGHYYNYVQRMLTHKDESFIAYLYDRAISYGSFKPEEYPVPLSYLIDICAIVNQYFSENPELAGKVTMKRVYYKDLAGSSEDEKRERLKEMAATRLKAGQPLIYVGDLSNGESHMCLAYDYFDKGKGNIMVHMGYKGRDRAYFNSYYRYNTFNDFAYLDISPDLRTIPNNPRFQVNGTAYSCHDLASFVHKEEAVCYEDEDFHAILSSDRDFTYEKHNFIYISNDTKRCTICGKTISTPSWSN